MCRPCFAGNTTKNSNNNVQLFIVARVVFFCLNHQMNFEGYPKIFSESTTAIEFREQMTVLIRVYLVAGKI